MVKDLNSCTAQPGIHWIHLKTWVSSNIFSMESRHSTPKNWHTRIGAGSQPAGGTGSGPAFHARALEPGRGA